MKQLLVCVFAVLSVVVGRAAEGVAPGTGNLAQWDTANAAYTAGDYTSAVTRYQQLLASGQQSAKLYYNLGNAYFKNGNLGNAILQYNRAQQLAPGNDDIAYNLRLVNGYVQDKIEVVPEFFLRSWLRALGAQFSSNGWAVLSLCFLVIALSAIGVYLLGGRIVYRKFGFFGGVIFLLFFVMAVSFATAQRNQRENTREAIVMAKAAPVKSSPDVNSKDIFILHEGTKVRIVSELGTWREIVISDGNKGWVTVESIESIN